MSALGNAFSPARAALIVYVMAGYPDRETSLACLQAAAEAGEDVIELGVPYGDPLADGPVIATAGHTARAAEGGFGLIEAVGLADGFLRGGSVPPVVMMTYFNPVLQAGLSETASNARDVGISGFIVPDLPPDGPLAQEWVGAAREAGVDTVFLAAPTSTPERLAQVAAASTGFVYCVSATGITGERTELPEDLSDLVARVRAVTPLPVAVGFGISTPEHAAAVARIAEGVVVGSAVVRRQGDPAVLGEYVSELAAAVRAARA